MEAQKKTGIQEIDCMSEDDSFTYLDFFFTFISLITFILDVGSDIYVAYSHYVDGNMWYFGLTAACVLVPTIATSGVNLRWYLIDAKLQKQGRPVITNQRWLVITLLVVQLTSLLRYVTILVYAWKAKKVVNKEQRTRYQDWLVYANEDAAFLRLFECFLESAPQFVLQLYIVIVEQKNPGIFSLLCMGTSLCSVSWGVVAHQKALRRSVRASANLTYKGQIFQFLWRFFEVIARILALALFASINYVYFFCICPIRWIIMSVWIISMKTDFCSTKVEEVIYNMLLGGIFIFCYFNPKEGVTRWRLVIYYSYTFVENTMLMAVWYNCSDPNLWYLIPAMCGQFLTFVLSIFFMITYYVYFHPTGKFFEKYPWTGGNWQKGIILTLKS